MLIVERAAGHARDALHLPPICSVRGSATAPRTGCGRRPSAREFRSWCWCRDYSTRSAASPSVTPGSSSRSTMSDSTAPRRIATRSAHVLGHGSHEDAVLVSWVRQPVHRRAALARGRRPRVGDGSGRVRVARLAV